MNEADKNKLIITTSWLFEAVNNQYRAVINDIRKSMMFSMYKLSTLFNKFNKNINLSFSLINQAQRNFVVVLKQAQFNSVTLNNIYKMYVKRGIYQEKMASEALRNLRYDVNVFSDPLFKNIIAKTYNLHSLLMDLERKFYLLCE